MMALVCVSYFISAMVFYFYGNYRNAKIFDWYTRWLMYPFLALVIELPNMLVIYVIHWQTYSHEDNKQVMVDFPTETETMDS